MKPFRRQIFKRKIKLMLCIGKVYTVLIHLDDNHFSIVFTYLCHCIVSIDTKNILLYHQYLQYGQISNSSTSRQMSVLLQIDTITVPSGGGGSDAGPSCTSAWFLIRLLLRY